VFQAPTPAQLAARLDPRDTAAGEGFGVLLPIRPHGDGAPLFCVHPANGLSWCYQPLARHVPADRPIYGLQARGLDGTGEPPGSIREMAADYLRQIRAVQETGPYHLLGWSLGGLVAHEIAVQLQADGQQVATLIVMDAYPQDEEKNRAGVSDEEMAENLDLIREQWGRVLHAVSEDEIAILRRIVENNARILRAHRSRRFEGDLLLVVAGEDNPRAAAAAAMWRPYLSGEIRESRLPCRHGEMAHPDMLARAWNDISLMLRS
jgi:thioesterase domain-containing protein